MVSFFRLSHPAGEGIPVLVEVPHAGLQVPNVIAREILAPPKAVLRDSDVYVDRLCAGITDQGASLLVAHVSRYVVDLNRAPDDVDIHAVPSHAASRAIQPRGVVWRTATDGRPVLRAPLTQEQFERRIALFHQPYHQALSAEIERLRSLYGYVFLVAAHSMPSVGRSQNGGAHVRRADVVPGTRGRTSADERVIELIEGHFEASGMSVAHDDPYQGGWTTANYGRPAQGVHAVQLELNRALYVDEATMDIKAGAFEVLRRVLGELVLKLGAMKL